MSKSTEEEVLEVYRRHLREPDLGLDDVFADHGGHSLIAFRILAEFRRLFPVTPQTEDFEDLTTARTMAGWLRRENAGT
jgi:acyl carrier protein